jgi:hypothetical protein
LFYDKTNFGELVNYVTAGAIVPSVTVQFPADNIDPGPRAGRLPTNPMLANGPTVNFALLNSLYPPGSNQRNTGDVYLDTPDRVQPHTQEISAGFQRQLGPALSVSADYVHTIAHDQWMLENLNPGLRVNTTASGAIIRVDPTYVTNVWQRQNIGSICTTRSTSSWKSATRTTGAPAPRIRWPIPAETSAGRWRRRTTTRC